MWLRGASKDTLDLNGERKPHFSPVPLGGKALLQSRRFFVYCGGGSAGVTSFAIRPHTPLDLLCISQLTLARRSTHTKKLVCLHPRSSPAHSLMNQPQRQP
jgi:hypothetical protein